MAVPRTRYGRPYEGDYEFRKDYIRTTESGSPVVPIIPDPVIPPVIPPGDDTSVYLLTEEGGYLLFEDGTRIVISYT